VLLTHVHLDHAGASGALVRRWPELPVHVHERGARHMIDPTKLLDSATRLYGKDMDRLWGEFLAVPAAAIRVLSGGERVTVAGRTFEVAYTPGHASHHVSYFDASSGLAFVGDTAGICIDGGYIVAPTPPPDIDIEAWEESARTIEQWRPATLFLTHFGPSPFPPATHLQTLIDHLHTAGSIARRILSEPGTDDERALRFADEIKRELRRTMTEAQIASYGVSAPFEMLFSGLARYWQKRAEGVGGRR
jgi:glyoxylase-like metal-dependent hydrolase (beta-lactamase superfamily II)